MSYFYLSQPMPGRAAIRWGHWGSRILIVSILAAIALVLRPLPGDTLIGLLAPLMLFAFVLVSGILMRQHDHRLCEDCMAAMPLNPSELSARYHRRFAVAHLASQPRLVIAYLGVLIASNLALVGLPGVSHTLGQYLWAVCQSSMIYLVLAYSTHRKLQPWCPQCSDSGGDGRQVDAPDPVPSGSQRG